MDADILPPSDDRIFKLLMISPEAKPGLIKLIAGIIGRPVTDVTVHSGELPIGATEEKAERLDVNCKIDDGSQINLEMQASRIKEDASGEHKNLKGKSIYYLCDLHSSQPSKGQRRYDRLARSYQITFCSYTVFAHRKEYINSYSMRHDSDNELLHDAIRMVFIELSKLDDIIRKPVAKMTDLEKFALFFEYASSQDYREKVNKIIESEEVLQVAGNLLMNISQNERERALFRSRRKYQTDYESDMATSKDIGFAEGIAEGEIKGEIKGEKKAHTDKVEGAKYFISIGLTNSQISKGTGLTENEIEDLRT